MLISFLFIPGSRVWWIAFLFFPDAQVLLTLWSLSYCSVKPDHGLNLDFKPTSFVEFDFERKFKPSVGFNVSRIQCCCFSLMTIDASWEALWQYVFMLLFFTWHLCGEVRVHKTRTIRGTFICYFPLVCVRFFKHFGWIGDSILTS